MEVEVEGCWRCGCRCVGVGGGGVLVVEGCWWWRGVGSGGMCWRCMGVGSGGCGEVLMEVDILLSKQRRVDNGKVCLNYIDILENRISGQYTDHMILVLI